MAQTERAQRRRQLRHCVVSLSNATSEIDVATRTVMIRPPSGPGAVSPRGAEPRAERHHDVARCDDVERRGRDHAPVKIGTNSQSTLDEENEIGRVSMRAPKASVPKYTPGSTAMWWMKATDDEQAEQAHELRAGVEPLQQPAGARDVLREQRRLQDAAGTGDRLRHEAALPPLADAAARAEAHLALPAARRRVEAAPARHARAPRTRVVRAQAHHSRARNRSDVAPTAIPTKADRMYPMPCVVPVVA